MMEWNLLKYFKMMMMFCFKMMITKPQNCVL
jgi:hypothetical protein